MDRGFQSEQCTDRQMVDGSLNLRDLRGFTLVELLVVIGIIGMLVAVLLPAIQATREAARRMECANNLKQIGLGLHSFESSYRRLPIGAQAKSSFGVSWWVEVIPYVNDPAIVDGFKLNTAHAGSVLLNPQNAQIIDGWVVPTLQCPSSPLPRTDLQYNFKLMVPSYVGISGATSHDGFPETRVAPCCAPTNDSEISGGGVLIPNQAIRFKQITDGLSRTLAVGECSDYAIDSLNRQRRIDGSHPVGWITGTVAPGTPPNYTNSFPATESSFNITTVRYGPNMKDYDQPGVRDVARGPNNPLISPHPGGVNMLMVGGAVDFVEDEIDLVLLKEMATRDDKSR